MVGVFQSGFLKIIFVKAGISVSLKSMDISNADVCKYTYTDKVLRLIASTVSLSSFAIPFSRLGRCN